MNYINIYWIKANKQAILREPLKKIKAKLFKKSEGIKGIYETVNFMNSLKEKYKKDKKIRIFTMNLIKNIKNKFNQAKKIYDYLKNNINYVSDIVDVETIQSPILTLKLKGGDCDDIALLSASMLESIGIPTKFVIAGYTPMKKFSHIYNLIDIDNKKYYFDVTTRKWIGYEKPKPIIKKIV